MKILFYGSLGETIGREIEIEPPAAGSTVADLRSLLAERFPDAEADLSNPALRACVADTIVGERSVVDCAAEVEFFPPLSGG